MKMEHYVLGFCFDVRGINVALIEKKRPRWQAGNWNGIGGHGEEGEAPVVTMRREWKEETGQTFDDWRGTFTFTCPGGTVFCFVGFNDKLHEIRTITDETVEIFSVGALPPNMMDNLRWMIPFSVSDVVWPVSFSQMDISHSTLRSNP